ncbi:transmembrane protein 8B isoform X2 [Penaeus vannamei]|uniref:Putative transmembrane protein 8A-like n=1 Tax=Penaeus vannamei TaxID=6689 RepID=A0A3R7QW68_PENVA|nr:transmembrane protein 8B-like [Penaeus vannamei]ROT80497.1 putative transmembrane protein 8A-like [Penaeus vannamei]
MMIHLNLALLVLLIGLCDTLVPEVSQEGLLQPYYTYQDVTLFHFHIPHEVTRATWEFAAFMDDPGCPVREVHVLVQHGSYPVVGKDNSTFKDYMYIERAAVHKVTTYSAYQPHDATILPVYNPLPGSWFAAAYIPNWNEQMQQEGIVHKCRYSLGSVAMWSQKEQIHTINIGKRQTVCTHENLSYYRFYVPSHTWFLQINITNCQIREEIINHDTWERLFRWCIRSLSLQARSLPTFDPDGGAANISQGGGHVFTETRPFSDGYYYLLVNTEGETMMDITIETKECGGTFSDSTPRIQEIKTSSFMEVSSKQDVRLDGTVSPNITMSVSTSSTSAEQQELENTMSPRWDSDNVPDESHKCYPILQLARIKHPSDFTDTFLIQGPEWYSTWLSMRGDVPVFTHLTLLPFTDIGGTLSINLRMDEILMNATSQLITVVGCIRKARPPEVKDDLLVCDDEQLTLNITSFSASTVTDFILIPFPEPDTWFLALQTICYYKGVKAPCKINQVMVSVDIRTQPCVFTGEQPCGGHGLCQETHRGMFFFTSCICTAGWEGWGCEDGAAYQGWNAFLTGLCLLTVSNVFFIPPTIIAIRRRLYAQALLFTATMIASIFYHACDNEVLSYCLTKYEVLQFTDFFFSLLCFWVTIVNLAGMDETLCPFLHTLGVVIIAPAVQYSRTALASFTFPMAVATAIPICRILYRRWHKGSWPSVQPRQILYRGTGVGLALVGLMMFALIQTKDNYKYVHSAWHVIIAISLVFLLPSQNSPDSGHKVPYPTVQFSASSMVSDDAELIDVGSATVDYTTSSPVFQVASDVDFLLADNSEGTQ